MARKKTSKHSGHPHFLLLVAAAAAIGAMSIITTQMTSAKSTRVPGHDTQRYDQDNNGIPDEGVTVNGHYTSLYAYDAEGDWYWDLGDGRIQGTVSDISELNKTTITSCDYVVNYRGSFDNDPFMDSGWIQNLIKCSGYDDNGQYNYLIVSQNDPRYTGNPNNAIWGTWEYHVNVESKKGNLARPENHI